MVDHPSVRVYSDVDLAALSRLPVFKRATFPMTFWEPDMPFNCAVSFFYFPGASNLRRNELNLCVERLGILSDNSSASELHGDVLAVLHDVLSDEVINCDDLFWVRNIGDALLECVHLPRKPRCSVYIP